MKVLVIDNVRVMHQLIASLFESSGLEPVVATSGDEGLRLLESHKFEFICISMHLQNTNGIDICRIIRNSEKHIYTPVILFTSEHSPALLSEAITSGVTEIFDKTTELDQLVAYIKRFTLQHSPIEGKVLYIEDSMSLRQATKIQLQAKGLEVDDFSTAEDAWKVFQDEDYDLVITDILLAGTMSGVGLVNKIRRLEDHKGDVPILAITGFDDIARRIELFHMGVNDYAAKPVVEEELIARVRYLIGAHKSSERQYSLVATLFEYSPTGICVLDHEYNLIKANDHFYEETGLISGKARFNLSHHMSSEQMAEMIQSFENSPNAQFTLTIADSNGSENFDVSLHKLECNATSMPQYLSIWEKEE